MAYSKNVTQFKYATRSLDFYLVMSNKGVPLFAPCMYLFELAKRGIKPKSIRAYSFDLAKFFTALEHTKSVTGIVGRDYRDVNDLQMTAYLDGLLKKELNLSDKSIERHITTLSGFYKFSYEYGLMSNHMSFSFKYGTEEEKMSVMQGHTTKLHATYIDENAFKVLLENIPAKDPFIRERDRLALILGYCGGFRTSELVWEDNLGVTKLRKLLPEEDIRLPKAIKLKVLGKNSKTREVQLTVDATTAIYDFLWGAARDIKTTLMCHKSGQPLKDVGYGTTLFSSCVKHYLAKKCLEEDEISSWLVRSYHVLRKCYATNSVGFCYRSGLDPRVFVSQWMGHSDPKTTEIYIFYDAVLNQRLDILKTLNLDNVAFSRSFRYKFNK